jgi:hypothetical protein
LAGAVQLLLSYKATYASQTSPDAAPHAQAETSQVRASVNPSKYVFCSGYSLGQVTEPGCWTQGDDSRSAVGFGTQTKPASHPPPEADVKHMSTAFVQFGVAGVPVTCFTQDPGVPIDAVPFRTLRIVQLFAKSRHSFTGTPESYPPQSVLLQRTDWVTSQTLSAGSPQPHAQPVSGMFRAVFMTTCDGSNPPQSTAVAETSRTER